MSSERIGHDTAFDTVFRRENGKGAVAIDRGGKNTEARAGTRASLGVSSKQHRFLYFNTIIFFISTNIRDPSPGRASRR